MALTLIKKFLQLESSSGIILFIAALLALIWANSPFAHLYQLILNTSLNIQLGDFYFAKPIQFWINEGLMTMFFFVIGLELKREFFNEESNFSEALLPGIAALGGMIIPALIYVLVNSHDAISLKGWAVPVATDIAFALGVLSLFGKRVPIRLKLFLMALAIFDDVGAIIIIAFFYTNHLSFLWLFFSGLSILLMRFLNRYQIRSMMIYLLLGILLWSFLLKSGVHPTITGVILAFVIPGRLAQQFENILHPWVAYLIMPIFALANAGVSFSGLGVGILVDSVSLGIILGLLIGKPIGVFIFTWVAVRWRWAALPKNTAWSEMFGIALLCGIGFTMSLFLGTLAFLQENAIYLTEVRLGVLLGSALSGTIGAMVLHGVLNKKAEGRATI